MTSPWNVSAATDRVELDATGRAEATFTVTNQGPTDQRLVFDVVPGETADRAWFNVVEPQVLVPHGGSTTFLVRLAVPAGTPAGSRWFAGRAYSAERAPEETSVVSDRVAVEVAATAAPVPWWRRWWWLLALAALVVLLVTVLIVVLVVALGGDDPPPSGGVTVHRSGPMVIADDITVDLDELLYGGDAEHVEDLLFEAVVGPRPTDGSPPVVVDRNLAPQNGSRAARIGAFTDPVAACANASLGDGRIPVEGIRAGEVICVRTNEGRLSVLTVFESLGRSPEPLRLSVTTFES